MIPSTVPMADRSAIIKEAQKYLERGQVDKAISEWERLAREAPDAGVFNTIGDLCLRKGDRKGAVESFHKSAELFRKEGFIIKAIAIYRKIINSDAGDINAFIALGELSDEKQLIADAIKYYLSAADILSKSPAKEKFVMVYGRILSLSPLNMPLRDKVAGLFLKEGLVLNAAEEYAYIGGHYNDKGDYDKAKDYFKKAVALQPDNKDALLGLGYVYEKTGDVLQAVSFTKEAVNFFPRDTDLLLRCAFLLKTLGRYDDAVDCLSKALELSPANAPANRLLGDIRLIRGDRALAWESYKLVVDSMVRDDKIEEAWEITRQFKDIEPVETRKFLVRLYRLRGNPEAAYGEILELADMLSEDKRYEEAIEYYREALNLMPDNPEITEKIAALRGGHAGLPPETPSGVSADSHAEGAVSQEIKTSAGLLIDSDLLDIFEEFKKELEGEIGAEDSETHYNLGIAYKEMGLIDDAANEFLISGNDPERYVQSATMLGMCYMEKGLFSHAIDAFRGVLEHMETRDASYWEALYNLASAYEKNGNTREAGRILREICSRNPGFRDAAEKLNSLGDAASNDAGKP